MDLEQKNLGDIWRYSDIDMQQPIKNHLGDVPNPQNGPGFQGWDDCSPWQPENLAALLIIFPRYLRWPSWVVYPIG